MVLSPLLFIFFMLFFLVGMILLLTFILNSYFYSYILFILFVSGLMILFMYVCSIIVNEKLLVNLNSLLVLSVVWGVGVFSSFFFFFFWMAGTEALFMWSLWVLSSFTFFLLIGWLLFLYFIYLSAWLLFMKF
uniref:NADH dehydrogenase subunit 6 n=1 Tax=Trialeurodes vaporariorum TaxID=88556 RepID=Q674N0_TRIVP|nr:NADH dehydrogenase subunit 6 [Trialeurodes vaporariorum]AAU14230.1 NADH dehydrogenase subunit 6 [Trialeurodes vaporariorum]